MASDNTTLITAQRQAGTTRKASPVLALAIVWSRSEPHRVGEIAVPDDRDADSTLTFGRASGVDALTLMRQRPGANLETGPLDAAGISRVQWRVQPRRAVLMIDNVGRRELLLNGAIATRVQARLGDLLEIRGELIVLVVARARELAPQALPPALVPRFGEADEFGLVGESAAAWELRRQLAFAAGRDDHVLLTGASGSGKELAARAIHALSSRGRHPVVARNAATLPDGIIDAELFGNTRDYPNPGTPERPGLIGAAHGSTLFLDEIGEVSHALQAHLLRVVDIGEYHRLGEARARKADLRIVAATNRDPAALKHDLLARLRLRVRLPGLDKRREDIPLIARHLLRTLAARDRLVAERAFPDGDLTAEPSWTGEVVTGLLTAAYPTNVRELQTRLWTALARSSTGLSVESSAAIVPPVDDTGDAEVADSGEALPAELTAAMVRTALDASGGNRERAWRALGLRSRHQLLRLMRRFDIEVGRPPTPPG